MSSRICILNYGSGNVGSVYNLFKHVSENVVVSNIPSDVTNATHIVLPGVGSFGAAMRKVKQTLPLIEIERAVFKDGKPFLGICVGMQILAERGIEFGEHEGLGWVPGSVEPLEAQNLSLPHVGWNNIKVSRPTTLFDGLNDEADFYFVHSFAIKTPSKHLVSATSDYGLGFVAAIQDKNLMGVQFHPEKSQSAGLRLVRNFITIS